MLPLVSMSLVTNLNTLIVLILTLIITIFIGHQQRIEATSFFNNYYHHSHHHPHHHSHHHPHHHSYHHRNHHRYERDPFHYTFNTAPKWNQPIVNRYARFTNHQPLPQPSMVHYTINHYVPRENYVPLVKPWSSVRISYPGMTIPNAPPIIQTPIIPNSPHIQLYPQLSKSLHRLCLTGRHKGFYVGRANDHKNCYYVCPENRLLNSAVTYVCCPPEFALDFEQRVCIRSLHGNVIPKIQPPPPPARPNAQPPTTSQSSSSSSGHCEEGTMKPNPNDCNRYYRCMFRSLWIELRCPFNFQWNPKWQVCDAQYDCSINNTNRDDNFNRRTGTSTTTTTTTTSTPSLIIPNHANHGWDLKRIKPPQKHPFWPSSNRYWPKTKTKGKINCNGNNRWQPDCLDRTSPSSSKDNKNGQPWMKDKKPSGVKNPKRWYEKGYKYVSKTNKQNENDTGRKNAQKPKNKFWWPKKTTTTKPTTTTTMPTTTTMTTLPETTTISISDLPKKIPPPPEDDNGDDADDEGWDEDLPPKTTTTTEPSITTSTTVTATTPINQETITEQNDDHDDDDQDDNQDDQEQQQQTMVPQYSQTPTTSEISSTTTSKPTTVDDDNEEDTTTPSSQTTTMTTPVDSTVDLMLGTKDPTTTLSTTTISTTTIQQQEEEEQDNDDEDEPQSPMTTEATNPVFELPNQEPLVETTVTTTTTTPAPTTTVEPREPLVFEEGARCYEPTSRYKDDEDCQCFYECEFNKRLTRNCCPEGLFFNQIDYEPSNANNGTHAAIYEIDLIDPNLEEESEQHSYCDLPENIECKTIIQ